MSLPEDMQEQLKALMEEVCQRQAENMEEVCQRQAENILLIEQWTADGSAEPPGTAGGDNTPAFSGIMLQTDRGRARLRYVIGDDDL